MPERPVTETPASLRGASDAPARGIAGAGMPEATLTIRVCFGKSPAPERKGDAKPPRATRRALRWLPYDHPDWRFVEAEAAPAGGTAVSRLALKVCAVPPEALGVFGSENRSRHDRWRREAAVRGTIAEGAAGPLLACVEREAVFTPVCPICGGALTIAGEPRTLSELGLPAEDGRREYAWCASCSSQASQRRLFAGTDLQPGEQGQASVRPLADLLTGWSETFRGRATFERDRPRVAEDLAKRFPCWTCSESKACFAAATLEGTAIARQRLEALHWSSLPILAFPFPESSLRDRAKTEEAEHEALARGQADARDPSTAARLLERKLVLLRAVGEALRDAQSATGEPIVAVDSRSIVVTGSAGTRPQAHLLDLGGVRIVEGASGDTDAVTRLPPRTPASVAREAARRRFEGTLSCTSPVRVVPARDGLVVFRFEGKIAAAVEEAPDPSSLSPADRCVLVLPESLGVPEIPVELMPKSARAGELRFRTMELPLRTAVADELRKKLVKAIPGVSVRYSPVPGLESDLRALARLVFELLLGAETGPKGEPSFEESLLLRVRLSRPDESAATLLEDLRSTREGLRTLDASRLFGGRFPAQSFDDLEERRFPRDSFDRVLGLAASWLGTARADISEASIAGAVADLVQAQRAVQLFLATREPLAAVLARILESEAEESERDEVDRADPDDVADAAQAAAGAAIAVQEQEREAAVRGVLADRGVTARAILRLQRDLAEAPPRPFVPARIESLQLPELTPIPTSPPAPARTAAPPGGATAPRTPTDQLAAPARGAAASPPVAPPPAAQKPGAQKPGAPKPVAQKPSAPPLGPRDRIALAFAPLVHRVFPGSEEEAVARARSFALSGPVLAEWCVVLRLSIAWTHGLAESTDSGWPSADGKKAARELLDTLRAGRHVDAVRAATRTAAVVRDELAQQDRSLDQAVRTWSVRNAPERLRTECETFVSTVGDRAPADLWRHLASHSDDARTLRLDLKRALDNALRRDRNPQVGDVGLENWFAVDPAGETPVLRGLAKAVEPATRQLLDTFGGGTSTESAALGASLEDEKFSLLAWVALSLVGVEFLQWTGSAGRSRGLETEGTVARDLLSALKNQRAASYSEVFEALLLVPQRLRSYLHAHARIDSSDWLEWFEPWTIPRVVADIERKFPKMRYPRNYAQERWRSFCRECDEGRWSADALKRAFEERILSLLPIEAAS